MKYDKRMHRDSPFPGLYLMHSTHFLNFVRKLISYQYHILVHQLAYITMIVMPPPLGAGGIMFSGCPSVRPSEA